MAVNVTSCPACQALVNRQWTTCLVCRAALVSHADDPVTVDPAGPNVRPVYWESDGTILGPAAISYVAKSGSQFYLCLEWQDSYRWIHESLLRSQHAFELQGRQACNCCGGFSFWTSIHGATICGHCHPPAHPSLIRA